jgi:hypothetical protein
MDDHEMKTALFTIALFAGGAVALILYQHATHTSAIVAAATNGAGPPDKTVAPNDGTVATGFASLSGTGPLGNFNSSALGAAPVAPIKTGAGWSIQ